MDDDMMNDFFGDKACDAFVEGFDLNFDDAQMKGMDIQLSAEEKKQMRDGLMKDDIFAANYLFGPKAQEIVDKQVTYNQADAAQVLIESGLAGNFYPKDHGIIQNFLSAHG